MRNFKLNDGDLVLNAENNLEMISSNDEIGQCIERVLTTNKNEWFLDLSMGLEFSAIWGKGSTENIIKQTITEAILQVEEVDYVKYINIKLSNDRHLEVDAIVTLRNDTDIVIKEVVGIE